MSYTLRVNGKTLSTLNGRPIRRVIHGENIYNLNNQLAEPEGYLLFSSPYEFTLTFKGQTDGVLEYNIGGEWTTLTQNTAITSVDNHIKVRGSGGTYCRGAASNTNGLGNGFVFKGSNIMCRGNIATLLDYNTVLQGALPMLGTDAFAWLFSDQSALISSPSLPFTELTTGCYCNMFFKGGIRVVPTLPATIIPDRAYSGLCVGAETQGILDWRHVTKIESTTANAGTIDCMGKNLVMWFSPTLTEVGQYATVPATLHFDPIYTMYFFFTDDDEVSFTPGNMISDKAGQKGAAVFNMYTDNTSMKDTFLARAGAKITVNVYHLDGTPWPPTEATTEGGED